MKIGAIVKDREDLENNPSFDYFNIMGCNEDIKFDDNKFLIKPTFVLRHDYKNIPESIEVVLLAFAEGNDLEPIREGLEVYISRNNEIYCTSVRHYTCLDKLSIKITGTGGILEDYNYTL